MKNTAKYAYNFTLGFTVTLALVAGAHVAAAKIVNKLAWY